MLTQKDGTHYQLCQYLGLHLGLALLPSGPLSPPQKAVLTNAVISPSSKPTLNRKSQERFITLSLTDMGG